MDDILTEFLTETREHLAGLRAAWAELVRAPGDAPTQHRMLRLAHTIKGNCGFLALHELEAAADGLETALAELGANPRRAPMLASVRDALERLLHVAGTMPGNPPDTAPAEHPQPIGKAWSRLPGLARSLAEGLAKPIELDLQGDDVVVGAGTLALIRDPLTQLVRNAADHGIETAEVRQASGKPATGRITVSASRAPGKVVVTIADDGAGLDSSAIGRRAVARGLATEAGLRRLTPPDVWRLIFMPGLSTSAARTRVSGRGCGMDIVKHNIDRLGGTIELDSRTGQGTRMTITLPAAA